MIGKIRYGTASLDGADSDDTRLGYFVPYHEPKDAFIPT